MAKVDISVTRSLTINTGNYESIKPTVTLTARDIDAERVGDAYLMIDSAICGLIKMEIASCTDEMKLASGGLTSYCRSIERNKDNIGEIVEQSLEKLNTL